MKKEKVPNCQCAQCGKPKYKKPYKLKLYPVAFCNRKCMNNYKLSKCEIACDQCGKRTYKSNSEKSKVNKNFCSRQCYSENNKTGKRHKCESCEQEVYRPLHKKNKSGKYYCSKDCYLIAVKPIDDTQRRFQRKKTTNRKFFNKNKIFKKYGHQCQNIDCLCSQLGIELDPVQFDIDHKDNNRENNKDENALILCVLCHKIKTMGLK